MKTVLVAISDCDIIKPKKSIINNQTIMLETSKDVLNIVLAACVAIFTFFVCWGLYYLVMMMKKGNQALKEISTIISTVKEKIEKVERLIDVIEEKVTHSASYLPLLFKGITELLDFFKKKKDKTKQKNNP